MHKAVSHKSFLPFLALVVFVILIVSSITFQNVFFEWVAYFKEIAKENSTLSLVVFFALAAASAMLSPFSSVPLVPTAILTWGKLVTFILLVAGWTMGGALTYAIGSFAGHPLAKRFIPFKTVNRYLQQIPHRSQFQLVLLFRLASPAEIPGYVLGILRYNFFKYLLATFLTELPFAFATVYASDALLQKRFWVFFAWSVFVILFFSLAIRWFKKILKKNTLHK
jgi:uncharacterized membrane protein YdjX (TVP38/TMEM64 family)